MDMKHKGFVALDFEHLYPAHETACEVGAIRVVDGLITGRFYSTIRPSTEFCAGRSNSDIIGLTLDMLATAPEFTDVYAQLRAFCGVFPLVAHHSATETSVLSKCCELYGIRELLGNGDLYDTYDYTRKSLVESCAERNIPLLDHHNPLADAEATARLFLAMTGTKEIMPLRGERKAHVAPHPDKTRVAASEGLNRPRPCTEVERKDTPFFGGTKVVVSGTFSAFPIRADLERSLWQLGATVNNSVSSRTRILVAGPGAGWEKLAKAKEYGCRIMNEEELMRYIDPS